MILNSEHSDSPNIPLLQDLNRLLIVCSRREGLVETKNAFLVIEGCWNMLASSNFTSARLYLLSTTCRNTRDLACEELVYQPNHWSHKICFNPPQGCPSWNSMWGKLKQWWDNEKNHVITYVFTLCISQKEWQCVMWVLISKMNLGLHE